MKGVQMAGGKTDKAKGRAKEAAGALAGDKSLKNEGKVDRAAGGAKKKVGDASKRVKDMVNPDRR
jgi:uncharacterized protein YjbJ (UPF0337 family)